jgi:hypothetical protein
MVILNKKTKINFNKNNYHLFYVIIIISIDPKFESFVDNDKNISVKLGYQTLFYYISLNA